MRSLAGYGEEQTAGSEDWNRYYYKGDEENDTINI